MATGIDDVRQITVRISSDTIPTGDTVEAPVAKRPTGLLLLAALLWFGLLWLFHAFPSLDLAATGFFFEPAQCPEGAGPLQNCGLFPLSQQPWMIALRYGFYYLPHATALIIIFLMVRARRQGDLSGRLFIRRSWILLASLLVGPVILVNGLLKGWSGRPRPYDSLPFGGDTAFAAAGDFTGSCARNCSFISGEASGMGWLVCAALLIPRPWRAIVFPPLLAMTVLASSMRVMFGGHYMSDALLGWLSSIVVFLLLAVIAGWPQPGRN